MPDLTLSDVKTLLDLRGTTKDAFITAILPVIKEGTRTYLDHQLFKDAAGVDDFPALVQLGMVKWIEAFTNPAGVRNFSRGDVSTAYEIESGVPATARAYFDDWARKNKVKSRAFGFIPAIRPRADLTFVSLNNPDPIPGDGL